MKLTRIIFIALAVMLPTSWTIANAEDPAPPAADGAKKEKKAKKAKKTDMPADGEKKDDAAKK